MVAVDTHCHASAYWFEPVEVLLGRGQRVGVWPDRRNVMALSLMPLAVRMLPWSS